MQTYINPQLSDWSALTSRPTKEAQDLQKTLPTFEKRYNVLVNQMEIRKAPQKQIEQLKKIKQRYEQIVEKTNGKEI